MPNDDYVKRSDALEHFGNYLPGYSIQKDEVIRGVEELPAADVEPKKKWIPVTERLPDTNAKVLVWIYDPDFYEPYMDFGYWLNEIESWGEFNDDVGDFKYYTIIAWMPLPEPPKEEDDDISRN